MKTRMIAFVLIGGFLFVVMVAAKSSERVSGKAEWDKGKVSIAEPGTKSGPVVFFHNKEGEESEKPELKRGHVQIEKTGTETGSVIFFHRKHKKHAMKGKKCKTCHHVGRWGQSCGEAGCHDDPELDREGERIHVTCMERCHQENEGSSPTECEECHQ